jgi:hypothetical protein
MDNSPKSGAMTKCGIAHELSKNRERLIHISARQQQSDIYELPLSVASEILSSHTGQSEFDFISIHSEISFNISGCWPEELARTGCQRGISWSSLNSFLAGSNVWKHHS